MRPLAGMAILLTLYLWTSSAVARGTLAGTDITTRATVTYMIGGESRAGFSNDASIIVDEILDFAIVWQDAVNVAAVPGDLSLPLAFRLENTGNGFETYRLTALEALAGDDFDPALVSLHLDTNANGAWDPGLDELYVPGGNDPFLAPDEPVVVFLLADIPSEQIDGDLGQCKLVITSEMGTGPPGTIVFGGGDEGTDALIGTMGGTGEANGVFVVTAVTVMLAKVAAIIDPQGGAEPCPGALVTYSITVSVTGAGTACNVVISDPLPEFTAYNPNSLRLNGVSLSDVADVDAGDFGASEADAVTVVLGDFDAASPAQEITFQVIIE